MANYEILLGVKLDTSNIQSQIDKAAKNKKIKLSVKLDTKGISEQIRAINSKTPVKVAIKLDTKSAQSQINNIRKQIQQLGNIKINLGGTGVDGVGSSGKKQADEVTRSYKELMKVLNELNSKKIKLNGLTASSSQSSQQIQKLRLQIEQLENEYNNLINTFKKQGIKFSAQQWNDIENAIAKTGRQIDVTQAKMSDNSAIKNQTQAYKELLAVSKQISSLEINLTKLKGQGGNTAQISELERQLRTLQATYRNLVSTMNTPLTSSQWSSIYTEIARTQEKITQLNAKLADTKAKLASGIKLKLENGTFANDISRIETGFNSLANKSVHLSTGIEQVKNALASMRMAASANDTQALINASERYHSALKQVENQLRINARAEKEANNTAGLEHAKKRLSLEMSNWLKNNSAAAAQFGGRIQELQAKINSCNRASLVNLRAEFQNITKQATLAGKATQTFRDKLKTQFSRYSSYFSVASAFMYTTMALRDMFRQVVSIDTAMTELKKVTDETNSTYNKFLSNAATRSKEFGTTIDGLVNSTADFARLGYEFTEAQGLAEVANIYAVVGDQVNGVEGATESLISTLSAFKDEMNGLSDTDFAMSIIDKFNEVSNNFAISSGGIGEALKRSASSLASANNTLDESIALITAANTVVQDPDRVGNAFKTVSMRIRGAKTELEEAGLETEGMVESTAKLRAEIMALSGVDIMLNENTFKSTYQIMDELSQKWEDLSDIAQATVIELIAGKHQGNVISSLMSNFDVARDALETSLNSSGSAMKEHEKWQQSLEARINKLKATWQSLAQSFMDSNFLKGILEGITSLIDNLDKLINMFGTLPTLLGAFAAGKYLYSGKGFFQVVKDEATGAAKGITTVFGQAAKESENVLRNIGLRNNSVFKDGLKSDIAALNNYRMSVKGGMSETVAMSMHMKDASAAAKEYAKSGKLASEGVNGFVKQQKAVQVSMLAQNKSLSNASAIIKEYNSGCKSTGMSQKDFRAAVAQTNPALATQLSATKSTKTAMAGYVTSLVGAKVATIGLQVATMALNMALTMGIAALVSWGISKLGEYIETSKELAERIDEVTSKYKEQKQELNKIKSDYDTSNEDSMISKYGELSKGVNALGENISLTADEYAEYRDIVNTVAEQIPGLVTGYNSQGDAILSCAGDVNTLAEAYRNLILEQNKAVIDTGGDIFKDFKNNANLTSQMEGVSATRHLDEVNDILESYKKDNKYENLVMWAEELSPSDIGKITKLLEENGFEQNTLFGGGEGFETKKEFIVRAIKEDAGAVKDALKYAYDDINAYADDLNTFTDAYLSTEFLTDYSHMSDRMQGAITQIASSFDTNFYEQFKDIDGLEDYLDSMLSAFDSLGVGDKASFEAAFDLKTKFNGGDISYGEYVNGLQKASTIIDEMDLAPEIKSQIKLSLGLSEIEDGKWAVEEYENLLNRLTSEEYEIQLSDEEAKSLLNELTASEYNVLVDLVVNGNGKIDLSNIDINSLREYIEKQAKLNEAMNFTINMTAETEGIDAFNSAMAESVTGAGLSSDAISVLKGRYSELASQGYDLSAMFEETANGIHLNRRAVNEFEKELASQKLSETEGHLKTLKGEYDDLTDKIKNCTYANEEERASLYAEQQAIARKINDLATLASQYEGLTSAYNNWIKTEEAGSERDMYENVISGFGTMEDELSRGWIDDGTIAFLELLTGRTDLAVASTEELKNVYGQLDDAINSAGYSIRDFFTVDADGNSTNTGVYNFLETVEAQYKGIEDVIKKNAEGEIIGFDFNVLAKEDENGNFINGDKVIAEALGISEEVVQIMLRAADDAGFVVTLDGKWTQLADLKDYAQNASNELKLLKENSEFLKDLDDEELNFNFNASSLSDLESEFEKANNVLNKFKNEDGTLKLDEDGNLVEGAKQALDIATYYQAAIDKLTEPAYMNLDASQVEEELQKPLEEMQRFEDLVKTKHQLALEGKSLEETEAQMREIAEYLHGLEEEQKIGLGIDPNLSTEEIMGQLENGEIEIPATVDLQVEMSEDLKDIRLLMMNQIGLIEDEEVKLKVGYDIDDSVVNVLTDKEQKVVVKYIEENKEWFDGLTEEEREIAVKLIADGEVDTTKIDAKIEEALNSTDGKTESVEATADVEVNAGEVDASNVEEAVYDRLNNGIGGFGFSPKVELTKDDFDILESFKDLDIEVVAKTFGVDDVDQLSEKLESLDDTTIEAIAKVFGIVDVEKLKNVVNGLDDKTVQAIAQALGTGDVAGLKGIIDGLDSKTVQAIAQAFGFSSVEELKVAIGGLDGKTVEAVAQALGLDSVEGLKASVNGLDGKTVEAIANAVGKSGVDSLKSAIASLKSKTINVITNFITRGKGKVNGTANVNGTAFANGSIGDFNSDTQNKIFNRGNWRTKNDEVALTGELGPEIVVTKDNRWYTVGDTGAEFAHIPKDSIVFNHKQTKELLSTGKVTSGGGRGRALIGGTAYSKGTDGGWGKVGGSSVEVKADNVTVNSKNTTTNSKSESSSSKSDSSSSDTAEEFKESVDWIEIAIDRLERSIDQLDTKASSAYRSWEERNSAIASQIGEVGKEITLQQQAYDRYMQEVANVGLDESYAKLVREGSINIEEITDEELADKISQYQEWYEKALDCKDAILELQEAEAELYKQRFDNVLAQYEGMLSIIEHEKNMLDEFVAQSEAQGWLVSEKYYEALISNEQKNIAKLQEEKSALLAELQTAMQSGKIAKGSEAWYEMVNAIDEVTLAIAKGETAILEYQQALQQVKWEQFDLLQEQISAVTQEADFLIDLMSNKKLHDKNGQLTDEGMATMGMHGVNYNVYMNQADQYGAEAKRLEAEMANDPYDMELEARYREVVALQQEAILAAEAEKDAIRDLVEEGINLELEALQERIDLYNENLNSAKDLYEYNKKVKEQTEEIAALEKQIASYKNDNSEETRAKLQELKVALEDAKLELEETEYDKFIDDQEKLLDDLYLEYETILNSRLDNIDALVMEMIDQINANSADISSTIYEAADNVGYTLSDSMNTILSESTSSVNGMIAMYGENFSSLQTSTNSALGDIKIKLDNMIAALNAMAAEKVIEAENSSAANSPEANATPTTPTTPTTPQEPPKEETKQPTLTDDQLMGIAASIWVYGDKSGWGNDPIRSGKLTEKFGADVAKQVQSLINKHSANGDLYNFWVQKGQNLDKYFYNAFKSGARNIDKTQLAWTQEQGKEFIVRPSDGAILTPIAKGDSVLNANASRNIWNMANSPAEFVKDNLNLGIASTPNNSTVQNSYVQNFENITFSLPNVHGYSELLTEMQRDPKFEKLILSMTVDRIAGKSSLAKGKAIR